MCDLVMMQKRKTSTKYTWPSQRLICWVLGVVLRVSAVDPHWDCCSPACLLPRNQLQVITRITAGKQMKVEPGDRQMGIQKPSTWSTSHSNDWGDGSCSVFGCVNGRFGRSRCQSTGGERYWSRAYVLRCEGEHNCVLLLDPVVPMPQEPSTVGFLEWSVSTFKASRTSGKIGNHCCTQFMASHAFCFSSEIQCLVLCFFQILNYIYGDSIHVFCVFVNYRQTDRETLGFGVTPQQLLKSIRMMGFFVCENCHETHADYFKDTYIQWLNQV